MNLRPTPRHYELLQYFGLGQVCGASSVTVGAELCSSLLCVCVCVCGLGVGVGRSLPACRGLGLSQGSSFVCGKVSGRKEMSGQKAWDKSPLFAGVFHFI